MIKALYTASSGLVAQTVKQDLIANNIANANTAGYKRKTAISASFESELTNQLATIKQDNMPSYPSTQAKARITTMGSAIDNSEGAIRQTDLNTDFAIEGNGSFETTKNGKIVPSRAGNFQINGKGQLCTVDGALVNGESGPIVIPEDGKWSVGADGTVRDEDGKSISKIKVVGGDKDTTIRQGSVEMANVNIVREMVDMISNMRAYEANQKVISSVDNSLGILLTQVGKI